MNRKERKEREDNRINRFASFARIAVFNMRWIFITFLLLVVTSVAQAQTPAPSDDDVNRVAKQLYCPVCENIPLDVCPTQACAQWRETIREKLALGWDEQQIKDYFAVQYGDRVLSEPKAEGFSLLVWIIPPLVVLAGVLVWWRFIRSAAQPGAAASAPAAPSPADPYIAKLEQELERRR